MLRKYWSAIIGLERVVEIVGFCNLGMRNCRPSGPSRNCERRGAASALDHLGDDRQANGQG